MQSSSNNSRISNKICDLPPYNLIDLAQTSKLNYSQTPLKDCFNLREHLRRASRPVVIKSPVARKITMMKNSLFNELYL